MSAIEFCSITKDFGSTPVLKGIDLAVKPGEFLTLVGPSGCGKSTLLRILAGLESATNGRVFIGGADVTQTTSSARNLAMVFQSYALYPHLTVGENMMTPLKLRDLTRRERLPVIGPLLSRSKRRDLAKQVRDTAEILQIQNLLDRKPGQLSGGQRQRVALGRAMVRQPSAFLMDEPLSNLDAALRVHMRAELTQLHRRLGTTFVYVTHDQAEALTMSDRMAVMMGGRILQLDRPEKVYQNPQSLELAQFTGSPKINLLPGQVDAQGRVTVLGQPIGLGLKTPAGAVHIGVRCEHFSINDNGNFRGKVVYRENPGADVYLHVGLPGHDTPVILRSDPVDSAQRTIGTDVAFSPDIQHALVFATSGERLPSAPEPATSPVKACS